MFLSIVFEDAQDFVRRSIELLIPSVLLIPSALLIPSGSARKMKWSWQKCSESESAWEVDVWQKCSESESAWEVDVWQKCSESESARKVK
jgi:invasion protein IalB